MPLGLGDSLDVPTEAAAAAVVAGVAAASTAAVALKGLAGSG